MTPLKIAQSATSQSRTTALEEDQPSAALALGLDAEHHVEDAVEEREDREQDHEDHDRCLGPSEHGDAEEDGEDAAEQHEPPQGLEDGTSFVG